MVSTSINEGNVQAANYFVAQNYVNALTKIGTAKNEKILLLPVETAGVMGSIAGISELAKAAFNKG